MSASRHAALIRAAVDRLRTDTVSAEVLAAATTALTTPAENRAWLTEVARHIEAFPPCCRTGAEDCAYARHALAMARRILDTDTSALEIAWTP